MGMRFTEEMLAEDEKRWHARDVVTELGYCGNHMRDRKDMTNLDIRFYAYIMRKAHDMLKKQEPPKNASISSAIECLLHPQDADDSDMAQAIDTAVRAMRSLGDQEPRLMQFSEIMEIYNTDPHHVWPYNTPPYLYIQEHPHVRDSSESWAAWCEIRDIIEGELFGHTAQSYGKTWRCWTTRPDEKVRAETAWES